MEGLTEGRIVHYVLPNGSHVPAIVIKVWQKEAGTCNLHVFPDWANDGYPEGAFWATSIPPDFEDMKINSWHWIERA